MDSDAVREEIDVLRSIYCRDGEFTLHCAGRSEVSYSLQLSSSETGSECLMNIVLTKNYPAKVPVISVQCPGYNRRQLESIEEAIRMEAEKLLGQPMIMELTDVLQQLLATQKLSPSLLEEDEAVTYVTVILSLDHIRSRNQYCKVLSRWFDDLDLNAALLFFKHRIFLVVSGVKSNVQAYLKNHRTQNIDVDSSGRPCKERLLTVLGEEHCHVVFDEPFEILDFKTYDDLEHYAEKRKLILLYDKYIKPCII